MTEIKTSTFDVIIVGAGPAGCSTAICLADSGLKIALVDKDKFPREKVCGDGLTIDVINQLELISKDLRDDFINFENKLEVNGIQVYTSDGDNINILLKDFASVKKMFSCKRAVLDNFLLNYVKKYDNIDVFEEYKINNISLENNNIIAESGKGNFKGKIIVAADGQNSIISNKVFNNKVYRKTHTGFAIRGYYKNVSNLHPENTLEIHFLKNTPYGYFWIFPLPYNQVNVGLGASVSINKKKKTNLKKILDNIISEYPGISERFKNSEAIDIVKGGKLMVSGYKNKLLSSDRILFTGDSAYLANPFTGEGVGNAIRSGRIAASHVKQSFEENRFDTKFNKQFNKEINKKIIKESRAYLFIQYFFGKSRLKNYLIKRYKYSPFFKIYVHDTFNNYKKIYGLLNPVVIYKILFK